MTNTAIDESVHAPMLGVLLGRAHERLDRLFEDALAALEAGASEEAGRRWSEFDADLTVHLDLEEHLFLPAFAMSEPRAARALSEEHEQLRARLLELSVGIDLRYVQPEAVAHFVHLMRCHARREEALMYRWLEQDLADNVRGWEAHDRRARLLGNGGASTGECE
jgi:hypothetical protein